MSQASRVVGTTGKGKAVTLSIALLALVVLVRRMWDSPAPPVVGVQGGDAPPPTLAPAALNPIVESGRGEKPGYVPALGNEVTKGTDAPDVASQDTEVVRGVMSERDLPGIPSELAASTFVILDTDSVQIQVRCAAEPVSGWPRILDANGRLHEQLTATTVGPVLDAEPLGSWFAVRIHRNRWSGSLETVVLQILTERAGPPTEFKVCILAPVYRAELVNWSGGQASVVAYVGRLRGLRSARVRLTRGGVVEVLYPPVSGIEARSADGAASLGSDQVGRSDEIGQVALLVGPFSLASPRVIQAGDSMAVQFQDFNGEWHAVDVE